MELSYENDDGGDVAPDAYANEIRNIDDVLGEGQSDNDKSLLEKKSKNGVNSQASGLNVSMNSAMSNQFSANSNDRNGGENVMSASEGGEKNRVQSHLTILNKKKTKGGKGGFFGNGDNHFLNKDNKDEIAM